MGVKRTERGLNERQQAREARIAFVLADAWAQSPAGTKYSDVEAAFKKGELKDAGRREASNLPDRY